VTRSTRASSPIALAGIIALGCLVLAGLVVRVLLHHGVTYSPADEQTYATYSCEIAQDGPGVIAGQVSTYLGDPQARLFPPPTRWGLLLPDAAAAAVAGCGPASVAWVSTLAGIALLVLVAVFTWRRFSPAVALVATAFVASSPLQLHLGRRALGDELVALIAMAAFWAILAYSERRTRLRWLLAVALLLAGFATKEVFVMLYPALVLPLAVSWWRQRRSGLTRRSRLADLGLLILPAVLNAVVVAALARDVDAFWQVTRAVQASADSTYAAQYLSGAPHRLVIDLLLMSPVVVLLALVSFGLLLDRGTRASRMVAGAVVLSLVPFAFVGVQLVRLVAVSDVLIAILAAWGLVTVAHAWNRGPRIGAAAVAVTTAGAVGVNIAIFVALTRADLYDPVTDALLRALGMIP
jgi:4-amino-4-deoxy-L-arabinose transferase-like glycosyltransferase